MRIVVIGSINTDLVIHTSRIPKIGETIQGSDFSVNCGGKVRIQNGFDTGATA